MAPRKEWDDDDGRTIADMSGIERPAFIMPRIRDRKSSAERGRTIFTKRGWRSSAEQESDPVTWESEEQTVKERPWENESEFTPQERRMYVLGALKAALLIALAFIVGLGAAVWIMIQVWT